MAIFEVIHEYSHDVDAFIVANIVAERMVFDGDNYAFYDEANMLIGFVRYNAALAVVKQA